MSRAGADLEVRLLGPVGIWEGGRWRGPSAAQQCTVLAMLSLESGRVVPVDRLVMAVWDTAPPATARNALHGFLSRLRPALPPGALQSSSQGYRLALERDHVDVHRFRALARQARHTEPQQARETLDRALRLWRGPALAGVAGRWLPEVVGPQLTEERLAAMDLRAEADLQLGRYTRIIDDLSEVVAEDPTRERLALILLTALHRSGRRADALALFRRIRQRLVEDLGIEPGAGLQEAHRAALDGEPPAPAPCEPGGQGSGAAGKEPAIRHLPAAAARIAGRQKELHSLDGDDGPSIWVIHGAAGVGKSTLALQWAQRAAARFPDGQLHFDLRGFSPNRSAAHPAEMLPTVLQVLRVPEERVPAALDAQVALYRSTLAGQQMIIVLDNVRDAEQARPLLPGVPGCVVVITSRNELTSLVVHEGARSLPLDMLSPDEGREMLSQRLGSDRVAAEPHAVDDLIMRCAGLPLALAIMAGRAAVRPHIPLRSLLCESGPATAGLDLFDGGDAATRIRAVFSSSYRALTTQAARLFRLLALHPGPDITVAAAASLLAVPAAQAASSMAELVRGHLIGQDAAGRYSLHDLLRAYADEMVRAGDGERRPALHRLFEHYLHSSYHAHLQLAPHRTTVTPQDGVAGVQPERPADDIQALAWFAAEWPVLLAAVTRAAGEGFRTQAWQLAWTLTEYCTRRGYTHDWIGLNHVILEILDEDSETLGRAYTHRGLALGYAQLDRHDEASQHFEHSLRFFRRHGDLVGQGHIGLGLAWLRARQDRRHDALHHARQALADYERAGNEPGQAAALNAVGWYQALLGNHRETLIHCEQAIPLHQRSGDRRGEASTWDSLGYAFQRLGDPECAIRCGRRAVELYRMCGDRYNEADALDHLGDAHVAGDPGAARDAWQRAAAILEDLGNPDAERTRRKLAQLDAMTAST